MDVLKDVFRTANNYPLPLSFKSVLMGSLETLLQHIWDNVFAHHGTVI